MVRIAGPEDHILRLPIDVILIIYSLLLEESFLDFTNFFLSWVPYQTPQQISTLLHNLDWTNMYVHERTWWNQPRQSFLAFLTMYRDRRIKHALCYDASKNLLLGILPKENLIVLQCIADEHSASFLAYHVFSPMYMPGTVESSTTYLLHFRAELEGCVEMLKNRRCVQERGLGWEDYLGAIPLDAPLCSFGRPVNNSISMAMASLQHMKKS